MIDKARQPGDYTRPGAAQHPSTVRCDHRLRPGRKHQGRQRGCGGTASPDQLFEPIVGLSQASYGHLRALHPTPGFLQLQIDGCEQPKPFSCSQNIQPPAGRQDPASVAPPASHPASFDHEELSAGGWSRMPRSALATPTSAMKGRSTTGQQGRPSVRKPVPHRYSFGPSPVALLLI